MHLQVYALIIKCLRARQWPQISIYMVINHAELTLCL